VQIWQFKGRRRSVAVNRPNPSNVAVSPPFAGRFNLTNMCQAGSSAAEVGDDDTMTRAIACCVLALTALLRPAAADDRAALDALIEQHATANGLPVALVRQVIRRESNFNPRAVYRGNYGLMQIRLGTARALGYRGDADGLLDPATNMTYAVPYLAGAYRAANGDEARTLVLYASGYHNVRRAKCAAPSSAVAGFFAKLKRSILPFTSCDPSPNVAAPSIAAPTDPSQSVAAPSVAAPSASPPSASPPSASPPSASSPSASSPSASSPSASSPSVPSPGVARP
jgi:transglycosylase-like protein with SLT domain